MQPVQTREKINMDHALAEKNGQKPRILVAPLDWGLGHATRCIPLIRELLRQQAEVWLAGEGAQEALLRSEFPQLPFLPLPGYRVRYARTKLGLWRSVLFQAPKIIRNIHRENEWLKQAVAEHGFHAVISDNRYGLYDDAVPCIFITHQLLISNPMGGWAERMLQKRNYRYINRFRECWVPDHDGSNNLSGKLGHPEKLPAIPVQYIGPLTRMQHKDVPVRKEHLLVILSGPEPQRSILENKIIREISHYNGTATIVRGLPGSQSLVPSTNMLQFFNHLDAEELNKEMQQAEIVIGRCGYSTVMDLAALQKKSVLIPTPGQTEQEYLADYLSKQKMAVCIPQHAFSLDNALKAANSFQYEVFPAADRSFLESNVGRLLNHLHTIAAHW